MGNLPAFTHIHCSSRFDRSADTLESDLDDWMTKSSIITVTEVQNNNRASTLREKGWNYFNAKLGGGRDDCAIAWRASDWDRVTAMVRRISSVQYSRMPNAPAFYLYACTGVFKTKRTGHKLLVSVSHFPAHIEGAHGFKTTGDQWLARKRAYLTGLSGWSTHVKDQMRKHHVDAAMIAGDWNLNQKDDWVQNLLNDHWGENFHMAWQRFPTSGGSLHGGPVAPLGAPGKGTHDRIIDGSLIYRLEVENEPQLMNRVLSSDHRPYTETFRFLAQGERPKQQIKGVAKTYPEWWGFGDYMDDEIYELHRVTDDG